LGFALLTLIGASMLLVLMFRWVQPPASAYIFQTYVNALLAGHGTSSVRYDWVPYDRISPNMPIAVVAGEDQKFPEHLGFDFGAIEKALRHNAAGKPTRGASTISQQVAKNMFLWPGRSYVRKGLEAWFTLLLEGLWSKRRILEVYLNVAELGERTFGVEAASRQFFGKSASKLGPAEAALLAAVLPNPVRYRVNAPSSYVRKRQRWILQQMRQLGGPRYLADL
jgi:monofunctional biosynthetic peptidoglycan transglycosylase